MKKNKYIIIIEWRKGDYLWQLSEMPIDRVSYYIEYVILPALRSRYNFKKCVIYVYRYQGKGVLIQVNADDIVNTKKH